MIAYTFLIAAVTLCHQGYALPLEVTNQYGESENLTDYLTWMRNYGYLQKDSSDSLLRVVDIEGGIRRMQLYGNIPQTGQFDAATIALTKKPRCGVPDPAGVSSETGDALGGALEKRYAHTGGKWEKTMLSFRILNSAGSGKISSTASNDAIRRAFKVWSDATPLKFEEKTGGFADIYLKFGREYHGDPYPFDGVGFTLAHAYPPMSGFGDLDGDVHFDDAEPFAEVTDQYSRDIDLFIVALHEIGHALGLAHSSVEGALMLPYYQPPDVTMASYTLPYDDQVGIQLLYGGPEAPPAADPTTKKPSNPGAPPVTPGKPEIGACNSLSFRAIGYIRGELFAFKGDRYWRIRTPKTLLTKVEGDETKFFWYNLPNDIDAAYERYHDQRIVFFKGNNYWEYDGLNAVTGFPKTIKELDARLPSNVDAVLTYNEYLKTYFFKGNQVWRFDEGTQTVDEGWPYEIDLVFPGIPADLGAAFRYKDGIPIFVKGSQYYMYNDLTRAVDPGYPKAFGEDFLGCEPGKLEGGGGSGAATRTPTLLGVVLGTLLMVLNQFL
ncbi:collagenase 3-like [Amphiura filiformis]|uniref:collagenase 3-like n=1 Tax=Amphiura filiformis TaxID=82378 RepID=UPI003B224E62